MSHIEATWISQVHEDCLLASQVQLCTYDYKKA